MTPATAEVGRLNSPVRSCSRVLPEMVHPRHQSPYQTYSVSDASAVRARIRAERSALRPAEVEPVWKSPTSEPVDFLDQWEMLFDEELQDETRLDRARIDKEMLDVVSVALRPAGLYRR